MRLLPIGLARCPQCRGIGEYVEGSIRGPNINPVPCKRCKGEGTIPDMGFCYDCNHPRRFHLQGRGYGELIEAPCSGDYSQCGCGEYVPEPKERP